MAGPEGWKDVLSFTQDHIQNLTKEKTQFVQFTSTEEVSQEITWDALLKLQKKKIKMELHRFSLIEYINRQQIHRGLRVYKEPRKPAMAVTFIEQWNRILNKCLLDLMVLIIDSVRIDLDKLSEEVKTTEATLQSVMSEGAYKAKLEELEKQLQLYHQDVMAIKIKKLKRDHTDYTVGYVYPWMNAKRKSKKGGKRVSFGNSSDEASSVDSVRSSRDGEDFREEEKATTRKKMKESERLKQRKRERTNQQKK